MKKRIFSGIRPTSRPHIGNYLGAMKRHVELQSKYDTIYCIVDYHGLISIHNAKKLKEYTRGVVLDYLAIGLEPKKSILFVQSDVPEHTELSWILSTLIPVSVMQRIPTYKEKIKDQPKDVNLGLLNYGVLMAADILMYKAEVIPVGKDQIPHIELTRSIARIFNKTYGETFPMPKADVQQKTAVILGTDGKKKMSKSIGNVIELFTDERTLQKQIMSMVTDPKKIKLGDLGHPEICNVFNFHKMFSLPNLTSQIKKDCKSGKLGCVECKKILFQSINRHLKPMREKRLELEKKPEYIEEILKSGAGKARAIAKKTIKEVKEKTGLRI